MSYKTELHCHTKEFSGCSNVPGEMVAEKYIEHGYSTVVITNHFRKGAYGYDDHAELCEKYFEAADVVRRAAGDRLNVITGMEVTFTNMPNDFLVYGMDLEMAKSMPDMFDMGIGRFHEEVKDKGVIVIQAHPFRCGQVVVDPGAVDGIEVFNGHPGWHSHNATAKVWALEWAEHYAKDSRYILTSGTDHHDKSHMPTGGIITENEITTAEELVATLKSGDYLRITTFLGESDY